MRSKRIGSYCCLRSQSYEFESNSQHLGRELTFFHRYLRSQSYEFESNSQRHFHFPQRNDVVWDHKVTNLKAIHNWIFHNLPILPSCLRSQSYEFESNSQQELNSSIQRVVVWDHKVTNLKAIHNETGYFQRYFGLFEITKLRIWKQFTTFSKGLKKLESCLRSQSYEFESNSQLSCNTNRS